MNFVGKREYDLLIEREIRNTPWCPEWGEQTPQNSRRVAMNRLTAHGLYLRPDYGRLADVRELLAFRLAPWLKTSR